MRARIAEAERRFGRPADSVGLLAVSKGVGADDIGLTAGLGQRRFGESYLSEALPKITALSTLGLEWHFIGPLQSNKTRGVATHFAWAHGVDRLKIAERLSTQRPEEMPPLQICIQVNVSGEDGKSGVSPGEALELVRQTHRLPRLVVRGLMAIPAPETDFDRQYSAFRLLAGLRDEAAAAGVPLDTLSMGMSGDLEAAIAAGSTCVRVGTALFGGR